MSYDDIFGDPYDPYSTPFYDTGRKKKRTIPERSVQYKAPGHTVVTYSKRKLNIYFPQSEKEFERLKHKRRSLAAKNRSRTSYYSGEYTYSQYRAKEKGMRAIHGKMAANTPYEDMIALLKDAHWEEVCGHKRWMFDRKTLVKEYNKYQAETQRMY